MRNSIKYKEISCRSYRSLDEAQFRKDIESIDFFEIFTSNDPDVVWKNFYCHINGVIERYCPLRIIKIPLERPSYITDEIIQYMLQRDKAYKVARKTNDKTDWNTARSLRTRVARELRLAKRIYICRQLEAARGDSHKFWRIVNKEFFGKTAPKISQILDSKNNVMLEGEPAANELNRFF